MAKKTFKVDILSRSSIEKLKRELTDYQDDLPKKCELLIRRLAESGVSVAKQDLGGFGKYITFSIQTEPAKCGCKGILLATNTGIIRSEWRTKDGIKSADVSPLLMAEFGSGMRAENPLNVPGVGQGTFPGQTHAFDKDGWWYMDLDGEWHHSYGITPKMPMYNAAMEMYRRVEEIAKEVFV